MSEVSSTLGKKVFRLTPGWRTTSDIYFQCIRTNETWRSIDLGTTPSYAMPPCSPLNPDTWMA
jgi:hypothetical protein